jgi:hypothetical protein
MSGPPTIFSFCHCVFLSPFVHGATVEQIFDNTGVEYVKGDPPCAPLQPVCSRSGAEQTAVLEPALPL